MKAAKPKVLILGSPLDYIDKQYDDQFKEDYDVDVCPTTMPTHITQPIN